ncbi:non-ribosomal peptide synthetase [Chitinophaga sp. GbtcB8]|uniref:non-ribosomal peptide synthetase n=1 Tax=Chitinophaga sp. GbtcB8 TaxID=2824753 RepID=UPI001C30D51F|nr:non-ribosomal peptide synthetase [Chitinophaga sp. GbtcB8]
MSENISPVIYPLTNPQKRIWYVEKTQPGTAAFCLGGIVRFKGSVDCALLQQAINECVRHNNAMRIRIAAHNMEQYVAAFAPFSIELFDFSKRENELNTWINKTFSSPFELSDAPLYHFAFYKLTDQEYGWLIKVHHIIMDGWSVSLMTDQVYRHYEIIKGNAMPVHETRPDYLAYLDEEAAYRQSPELEKDKVFWHSKFRHLPETFMSNINGVHAGKRITYLLEAGKVTQLRVYLQDKKVSLNTFYTALMLLYLYKTTNAAEITIGVPVANRLSKAGKRTIGMFTSTMPFLFHLSPELSFSAFLAAVHRELRACYAHQRYPYNELVNELGLSKLGYNNLFNVCVNYYNTRHATLLDNMPVENDELYNGYQYYPLQLVIKEWLDDDTVQLQFDFIDKSYSREKIAILKECLDNITEQVLRQESLELRHISLLDDAATRMLLDDYNNTDTLPGKTVLRSFDEQVALYPHRIAISDQPGSLTYAELNRKVDHLAAYLLSQGIGKGSKVCVVSERNIDYVVIIWAVLKAGACFVPIDHQLAPERRRYIIGQTEPGVIISNTQNTFTEERYNVIAIQDIPETVPALAEVFPAVDPEDIAYIMYTSGSTGVPKGVVITHANLANYINWAAAVYLKDETDVFAFYSSIGFDLTITSLFVPLVKGAQIRVCPASVSGNIIRDIIDEGKVTVIKLTPGHLSLIKDADNRGSIVRTLIVGGDAFSTLLAQQVYRSFDKEMAIYNEYGPTEATVGCMIYRYSATDHELLSVPVGRPAANTGIYILNADLQQLPLLHAGEIYIAGNSVAQGYFKNEEATRSSFLPDIRNQGRRMYKTGDYALFIDKDRVLYEGRKDKQVKIRGFRIELQEIEKVISMHAAVKEAVVIVTEGADKTLAACVVPVADVTEAKMKTHLRNYLPEYMIPPFFIFPDKIPLNINGKVDKEQVQHMLTAADRTGKTVARAAATGFEQEMITLLQQVLAVPQINLDDNFYFIGGDSIKAIQFSSKLAERDLQINVQDLLMEPVVGKFLSKIIRKHPQGEKTSASGYIEATPATAWFFNQQLPEPGYYTQSVLLDLTAPFSKEVLDDIFTRLVQHHDIFRVNYDKQAGKLFYNNGCSGVRFDTREYDLSILPEADREKQVEELGIKMKASFDITTSLLLQAALLHTGKGKQQLFITAHHLVMDGVSMRILLQDLLTLMKNASHTLPVFSHSYQDWALQFPKEYYHVPEADEITRWKEALRLDGGELRDHFFNTGRQQTGKDTIKDLISAAEVTPVLDAANKTYSISAGELLLINLALVLERITGVNRIVMEVEGHGRDILFSSGMDVYGTIGWFTQFMIRPFVIPAGNLNDKIRSVKDQLRNPEFKTPRFAILRDVLKVLPVNEWVRFNYLGDFNNIDNEHFCISQASTGPDVSPENGLNCLLELNMYMLNGALQLQVVYNSVRTSAGIVTGLITEFKLQLQEISDLLREKSDAKELSPSDFSMVSLSQSELDSLFD